MNLAFYYHIPAGICDAHKITLPGFLGVFLDNLAKEVDEFVLITHTYKGSADYALTSNNIRLVDLGQQTPAWHRHLFHRRLLKDLKKELRDTDALIVRSPSPLAPFFHKYIPDHCLLRYYVVGSYAAGAGEMKPSSLREWVTKQYLFANHRLFRKELKGKDIFVNSPQLKEALADHCRSIENIPSTTLSGEDIFYRENTCLGDPIHLLFTGRIDLQKGLMELVEAFALLARQHTTLLLHFVGWEENFQKPVETALRQRAAELNVREKVVFHGRKQLGEELWQMYRMADIYVIPSYHEGFPRTIWEAMAHSLPIVATSVGAIPYYLTNEKSALLIKPKNVEAIVAGINALLENPSLRRQLIANALNLVKENTLNNRAKQMIAQLKGMTSRLQ